MIKRLICIAVVANLFSCGTQRTAENDSRPAAVDKTETHREQWSWDDEVGTRLLTDGWNIHTTIQYDHIVDSLPDFYESLLLHYSTVFGELPYPRERLNVFLFSNEMQWQTKIVEMLGDEACKWEGLGRGGLTIDGTAVLYHLDRRGRSRATFRIAAHEGWHQYAESVFNDCLPTWLDEGIGTWMEGFRIRRGKLVFQPASNWDRLETLRKIVASDKLSTLTSLINAEPSELLSQGRGGLLGYYAQLWAFTSFLMEYEDGFYKPALRSILLEAVSGKLREPVRHAGWLFAFTENPEQMERDYRKWVTEYVRPGNSWR